jgi:hypothetical protein
MLEDNFIQRRRSQRNVMDQIAKHALFFETSSPLAARVNRNKLKWPSESGWVSFRGLGTSLGHERVKDLGESKALVQKRAQVSIWIG